MKEVLKKYKAETETELKDILDYWMKHTLDATNGGFIGRITHGNQVQPTAPKGAVLNARILWTFSAAYNLTRNRDYLSIAQRACTYFLHHFIDREYGGVYWSITAGGEPLDTKKQIYALSFAIYGLSEYYKVSGDNKALEAAIALYKDIVAHSYDNTHGGYLEALSREWKEMDDIRLSAKDANERKSMNTHLHVLEGFANLYQVWPDEGLKQKLEELVQLFLQHIISPVTNHLVLFFSDDWQPRSKIISYGHDIEAAWLLQEAAEVLADRLLLLEVRGRSTAVAQAAAKGLDKDGGLWYECDAATNRLVKQKHSWPQAEAMVGFFNAWQNTGERKWLQHSLKSWEFVKRFIKDNTGGEWHWGVNADGSPMNEEDKVGIWKCPYHNSRACMQIIQRINTLADIPTKLVLA